MSLRLLDHYKLDRTAISIVDMNAPSDEPAFWASKTPLERMTALEYLRQIAYGYDPDTERLQRVFEVVEREEG